MPQTNASSVGLCNTCLPHGSTVFGDLVPLGRDLIRSGRQGVGGRRRRARQLAAVSHLRAVRSTDSDLDARDVLRLRDPSEAPHTRTRDPVRVRRLDRSPAPAALHDQLLPDGDALHRLRHRDRLLFPLGLVLHQLAWFGFAEFAFFLLILLIAYVYVWRKGALEWQ